VNGAVDYTQTHLATEERIMEKARLAGYDDHKNAHGVFVSTAVDNILLSSGTEKST